MCCYSKHVNAVLYNWWLDIASHFLTHFLMVAISGCFLCSAWEKLCINRKAICRKMISNKPSVFLLSNRDTISFSAPSLFVAAWSVCWINLRWSCFDLPCPQRLHCQHCFSDESWVFFVFGHEKIFFKHDVSLFASSLVLSAMPLIISLIDIFIRVEKLVTEKWLLFLDRKKEEK